MKKKIMISVLALLLAAILLSCGAQSQELTTYEINQQGALGPYEIKAVSYQDGFTLTGLNGSYETQGRFIVAEVEIVASQSMTEGYTPLAVKAVDSAKREFELYAATEDIAQRMQQENSEFIVKGDALSAGETKKAIFVFEVPRESLTKSLLFTYQDQSAVYNIDKVRDGVNDLNICFDATKCPY